MRKIGIVLSMALFTVFASCEKDDKKPTTETGEKITKLEYSANEYTTFVYNSEKLLTKVSFADAGELSVTNIFYDAQKKVREVEGGDGFVYQFKYENGRVKTVDILAGATKIGFNSYEYNAAGQIKTITTFMAQDNNAAFPPFLKVSYEYVNATSANVSKITFEAFNEATNGYELSNTLEYSDYDNKQNPLKDFGVLSYVLFNMNPDNNPGKLVEKDENGAVIATTTFTYTYDSKGRPSQAVERVNTGGQIETSTTKFAY